MADAFDRDAFVAQAQASQMQFDRDAFVKENSPRADKAIRDQANHLLASFHAGQADLAPNEVQHLVDVAYKDVTPATTLVNTAKGIYDAIDPTQEHDYLGKLAGFGKTLVAAGARIVPMFLGSSQTTPDVAGDSADMRGTPQAEVASGAASAPLDVLNAGQSLATGAADLVDQGLPGSEGRRLARIARSEQLAHDVNKGVEGIHETAGTSQEAPLDEAARFGTQFAIPVGAATKTAPLISKAADYAVERAPEVALGIARGARPLAPAGAAAATYAMTGSALESMGAAGIPIGYAGFKNLAKKLVGKAVEGTPKAESEFSQVINAIDKAPYQTPVYTYIRQQIDEEASRLEQVESKLREQNADKLINVDDPTFSIKDLKGADKEIREKMDQINDLRAKSEALKTKSDVNRVLSYAGKLGLAKAGEVGVGGTTVAGISAAQAQPENAREAAKEGFQTGAAITAPATALSLTGALKKNAEPEQPPAIPAEPAPRTRPDLQPATSIPQTNQNAPTEPTTSRNVPVESTQTAIMREAQPFVEALGQSPENAQAKIQAAIGDLSQQGKPVTVENVVAAASQRMVPRPEVATVPSQGLSGASIQERSQSPTDEGPLSKATIAPVQDKPTAPTPSGGVADVVPKPMQVPTHPNYGQIREESEALAKENGLKGDDLRNAGVAAMAQAHSAAVGEDSDLATWRPDKFGRTTKAGVERGEIRGRLDPEDPLHKIWVDQLSPEERANVLFINDHLGQSVTLRNYQSAAPNFGAGPEGEHLAPQRAKAQAEAGAPERKAGEAPAALYDKSYLPTSFTLNKNGSIEANGLSADKLVENADILLPYLRSKNNKVYTDTNGKTNWNQLFDDLGKLGDNHNNGYTFDGQPVQGTPLTPLRPNPDFTPHQIPRDRFEALNVLLGNEGATLTEKQMATGKSTLEKQEKQRLSELNPYYLEPESREPNRLRDTINKAGDFKFTDPNTKKEISGTKALGSVWETVRPDLMKSVDTEPVENSRTLRPSEFEGNRQGVFAGKRPRSDFSAAGFVLPVAGLSAATILEEEKKK